MNLQGGDALVLLTIISQVDSIIESGLNSSFEPIMRGEVKRAKRLLEQALKDYDYDEEAFG